LEARVTAMAIVRNKALDRRQAVIGKEFPAKVAVVCLMMSKATQTIAAI
jgi:hypothetical protein